MNTYTFWVVTTIVVVTIFVFFLARIAPDDTKTTVDTLVEEKITIPTDAATFTYSGGCFWCTEKDSEKLRGVYDAVSGFTAGTSEDPTYPSHGDHREGSLVYYDPTKITFKELATHAFNTIDYTDGGGQFCDRGHAYSPAIYYKTLEEKRIIESLNPVGSKVAIEKESRFYPVNAGHQDYYKKNTIRYNYYRTGCGRDAKVDSLPKVGQKTYDKSHLTSLQYRVTQNEGTERAFTHEYHKNKAKGIYVDIVGGQALYSSTDKYDSGSGWPSFHKSIGEDGAVTKETPEFFSTAIELKSTEAMSHLGHIIFDNPFRDDRRRHCINGASLRFVPLEDMAKEGYSEWLYLFDAA